jgi:hypothetical protein
LGVKNDGNAAHHGRHVAEHRADAERSNSARVAPAARPAPERVQALEPVLGPVAAMSAALIAPIDVPITQSGSMPASCSAW